MKKKLFLYSVLPAVGVAGLLGANLASAHGLFGAGMNLTPDQIATREQAMFDREAQVLGISVDEVKAAWAEGKTMKDIMQERNISADQVQTRLKDLRTAELKTQLQALVDKGVITQAQADQRLQVVQNWVLNGKGRMGKFRGGLSP